MPSLPRRQPVHGGAPRAGAEPRLASDLGNLAVFAAAALTLRDALDPMALAAWAAVTVVVVGLRSAAVRRYPWSAPAGGPAGRREVLAALLAAAQTTTWVLLVGAAMSDAEAVVTGVIIAIVVTWLVAAATALSSAPLVFAAFSLPLFAGLLAALTDSRSGWHAQRWLALALVAAVAGTYVERRAMWLRVHRAEQQLRVLADHDDLTGLVNRRAMLAVLDEALAGPAEVAVCVIDVDHFKAINDAYGHPVGDEVLQVLAGRLEALVGASGIVARLGGDEFVVVVEGAGAGGRAQELAEALLVDGHRSVRVDGVLIGVTVSIGIDVRHDPEDRPGAVDLLRGADRAMYEAKSAGRRAWRPSTRRSSGR